MKGDCGDMGMAVVIRSHEGGHGDTESLRYTEFHGEVRAELWRPARERCAFFDRPHRGFVALWGSRLWRCFGLLGEGRDRSGRAVRLRGARLRMGS